MKIAFAALIVAVLLLIFCFWALAAYRRSFAQLVGGFLVGYWTGDPESLADSGLAAMTLLIAPGEAPGGAQKAYLTAVGEKGEILHDGPLEVRVSWRGRAGPGAAAESCGALAFEGGADSPLELPDRLDFSLSVSAGTLVLSRAGELWALLAKDVLATQGVLEEFAS